MFAKLWTHASRKNEVLVLSFLIAGHQINLIRILDFLRHIQNIAEALVVPMVSLSLGLLLPARVKLTTVTMLIVSSLLLFVGAISLGNYWITILVSALFFLSAGSALKLLSEGTSAVEFYAKELLGWIAGSLLAYFLLPLIGAELIFFAITVGFLLFYFWISKKRFVFTFVPLIVFSTIFLFVWGDKLNIYKIVESIPSKRTYISNSKYNGTYAIHSLGATILDTIWTPFDRIDLLQFPDGERNLFFSNQSWSVLPPSEAELELKDPGAYRDKKALILGLGSGIEYYYLENAGYRKIVGVEFYSDLIRLMSEKYSPNLFSRNISVSGDMRHFLETTKDRFDFILHSSPDLATKIGFSGWPIVNDSTTYEAFETAFRRLNSDGLLGVKSYYKKGIDFSLRVFHALRNLSPEHQVQIYILKQEMFDSLKTNILLLIKKGSFQPSDQKLISSIFPESRKLTSANVGDVEFLDQIQKVSQLDVLDLSIVNRDTLIEKVVFQAYLFGILLVGVCIFAVFTNQIFRKVCQNGSNLGLVFFSGVYWAILEFSLITYFSNTFADPILAFLVVLQALMVSSWLVNLFLPKVIPFGNLLSVAAPLLSLIIYYFALRDSGGSSFQSSVMGVFLFSAVVGSIASFNFTYALRQEGRIADLLAWNLVGFSLGAVCSWFLIKNGNPDLFINLLAASSCYGVLFFLFSRKRNSN